MALFITVAVLVFIIAIFSAAAKNARAKKTNQRVSLQYGADEVFVSPDDGSFAAINFGRQQVILGKGTYESAYSFNQIASVEVIANESSITQTNRGSQLLGTAVGLAALGGVGAILGGLSGSKVSRNHLRSLVLKVIVDDQRQPVYSITFFKSARAQGADPNSLAAKPALEKIERMHAQFVIAMRKVQNHGTLPLARAGSELLGEGSVQGLEKLWELKTKGILSEEEFASQKALLLGGGGTTNSPEPLILEANVNRTVTVTFCGNKINAIKALRELKSLSLVEAKRIVDFLPAVLFSNISPESAEAIRQKLAAAGVGVSVE
jgi:ribosomal protein L7/L12